MKLGCIFKLMAITILILGTSFYLYERYGKDFVSKRTEEVRKIAINKIDELLTNFSENEIKKRINDKFTEIEHNELTKILKDLENRKNEYSNEKFSEIINSFNKIINERNFNKEKIEELKRMIEKK